MAVHRKVMSACVAETPVNERLLCAKFKHGAGRLSVIVVYSSTESVDVAVKDQFHIQA